ncbi:chemotaxis protein CheD [Hydrogenispora ethanolica]|nr:chemotaxis protein CheD [Hydrogenispora ethanolica]
MNHYLFARSLRGERNARFGDLSIPYMIHLFRKMGAERSGLKAHIVGGGQHLHLNSMIGNENAKIAEEILQKHRIEIATRDTGGPISRKVIFNTVTGEIFISKVNKAWESDWYK